MGLRTITVLCSVVLLVLGQGNPPTIHAGEAEALALPPLAPAAPAVISGLHPAGTVPLHLWNIPLLLIPALDVAVPITTFPLDGISWAIDPWEAGAGHLQGTAWLDAPGNIALGAHAEYPNGGPGIFYDLHTLNAGDAVWVVAGGRAQIYHVTTVSSVAFDDLTVVYPTAHAQLTLITCNIPTYSASTGQYAERLVVVAEP